jgi:hypothetical protein
VVDYSLEDNKNYAYVMWMSNGWLNKRGKMIRLNKKMGYQAGDMLRLNYDQVKNMMTFRNMDTNESEMVKFSD